MSELLDMSLDDIIQNSKKSGVDRGSFRGRGRGHGRAGVTGSGPGPARRPSNLAPARMTPYFLPQVVQVPEMFTGGRTSAEAATKLYISNLDYGVTSEDLQVLFSEVGDLSQCSVHYDRGGRSKGTAEVVFDRHSDAVAAIKRYNNVQLDGKPMKIELVGFNFVTHVAMPPSTTSILGNPGVPPSTTSILGNPGAMFRSGGQFAARGRDRGGGGGGRGSSNGIGRGRDQRARGIGEKISAEDLDADLEKYRLEAMQIN